MRTMLVSVLVLLAQSGIPANAQPQAGAPSSRPAAASGSWAHPSTNRLFFFVADPKDTAGRLMFAHPSDSKIVGRPVVFGRPPATTRTFGLLHPLPITNALPQYSTRPMVESRRVGLLPGESLPPQDLWRLYKPKKSRLFFFGKP